MINPDIELSLWRDEWKTHAAPVVTASPELRVAAIRQQRHLRIRYILDFVAAAVFVVFAGWRVHTAPALETWLWAITVFLATGLALAFSIWNWHLVWVADVKSVADFTRDYRSRCLATVRASRFGQLLLVALTCISGPWLIIDYVRHRLTGIALVESLTLLSVLVCGVALWFARDRRIASQALRNLDAPVNTSERE